MSLHEAQGCLHVPALCLDCQAADILACSLHRAQYPERCRQSLGSRHSMKVAAWQPQHRSFTV